MCVCVCVFCFFFSDLAALSHGRRANGRRTAVGFLFSGFFFGQSSDGRSPGGRFMTFQGTYDPRVRLLETWVNKLNVSTVLVSGRGLRGASSPWERGCVICTLSESDAWGRYRLWQKKREMHERTSAREHERTSARARERMSARAHERTSAQAHERTSRRAHERKSARGHDCIVLAVAHDFRMICSS